MKAEFISRVMQVMNELGWDDAESNAFIGSDTTKVKGHIESVFVDAWRKCVNIFPKTYFTIKDFSRQPLVADIASGTGYVLLPEDFYSLVSFKMTGWRAASKTLIINSDTAAMIQANEYTQGNFVRPVCLLSSKPIRERVNYEIVITAKDVLEYYSLPVGSGHKIEEALYIPLISPLGDNTQLNGKLFVPMAYMSAGLVFTIFEKPEIAQMLEKQIVEMIKN
jgi:hypothetical protein